MVYFAKKKLLLFLTIKIAFLTIIIALSLLTITIALLIIWFTSLRKSDQPEDGS
jgi:ABC-type transport system involved in cytochrome bd biosynthesis fused ATPase/permease subunit